VRLLLIPVVRQRGKGDLLHGLRSVVSPQLIRLKGDLIKVSLTN
jgi:hypothetical protein